MQNIYQGDRKIIASRTELDNPSQTALLTRALSPDTDDRLVGY